MPVLFDKASGSAIGFPNSNSTDATASGRAFFQGNASNAVPVSQLPAPVQASLPVEIRSTPFSTATQILRTAVATTIADPIAGNPASLIPQMVTADYLAASAPTGMVLGVNQPRMDGWRFNLGANIITITSGRADTNVFHAPLRASYSIARTGTEIFLDAPVAYVSVAGVGVFQGSAGIGIRQRVMSGPNFEWNITPAFRWGMAGSQAYTRGSAAVGASVSSDFRFQLPASYTLAVTNTIAYNQA